MTATALAATVGEGQDFSTGRQLAAYLGLVHCQASSGGKVRLLGINRPALRPVNANVRFGASQVTAVVQTLTPFSQKA